jgi:hypothetical protein
MTRVQCKSKTTTRNLKTLRQNYLIAEHYPPFEKKGPGEIYMAPSLGKSVR